MPTNPGYATYLRSPIWAATREQYRASGRPWRCGICGVKRGIQLHHLTYERLRSEELDDFMPLCQGCHHQAHLRQQATGSTILAATLETQHEWRNHKAHSKPRASTIAKQAARAAKWNARPGWLASKLNLPPGQTTVRYKQQQSTRTVDERALPKASQTN